MPVRRPRRRGSPRSSPRSAAGRRRAPAAPRTARRGPCSRCARRRRSRGAVELDRPVGSSSPNSASSSAVAAVRLLAVAHSRRASRWLTMQLTEVASRPGSTPMSLRRAIALAAFWACSVVSTRWPVIAACTAMRAVSSSRISPTSSTSGSERRIVRRPRAKVSPPLVEDLDLVDALDLVLDRVLDRHQHALGSSSACAARRTASSSCRCRSGRRR